MNFLSNTKFELVEETTLDDGSIEAVFETDFGDILQVKVYFANQTIWEEYKNKQSS